MEKMARFCDICGGMEHEYKRKVLTLETPGIIPAEVKEWNIRENVKLGWQYPETIVKVVRLGNWRAAEHVCHSCIHDARELQAKVYMAKKAE